MDRNEFDPNPSTIGSISGTKLAIFRAAVDLFFCKGFTNVGIRQVAKAVGIKSSSIYNHFENKEAIAKAMYRFFYTEYYDKAPFLEDVLEQIPGLKPEEALDKLMPPCEGPVIYDIIQKIISIAIAEQNNDKLAGDLIADIYGRKRKRISAVLERYMELDLIDPIDVNQFIIVFTSFSLSPAVYRVDGEMMSFDDWRDGRRMLFHLIRLKK